MTMKQLLAGKSQAKKETNGFVEYGYGQVEPNHLSAQRTGQIYAQLPTASNITVLENGQFVKYDYAENEVNFSGAGEWMLVFNEIKLYRNEPDCAFAMIKGNYINKVYSPYDAENAEQTYQSRFYGDSYQSERTGAGAHNTTLNETGNPGKITTAPSMFELDATDNPFTMLTGYKAKVLEDNKVMFPRVLKTNIGDIFTTNTIQAKELTPGDILTPGANGILTSYTAPEAGTEGTIPAADLVNDAHVMKWQVVKVYTMPDGQQGAKIMRIA